MSIQFIKVEYRCDVCKAEIQNEQVCRNGCFIKNPTLNIQVLCLVEDGTGKANLELKNEKAIKAFDLKEEEFNRFKRYCLKNGSFQHPRSEFSFEYKEIYNTFSKRDTF